MFSGGLGEAPDHVLVEAEVLFGGLNGEPAMQGYAGSEIEFAGVASLGQGFGDRLCFGGEVGHGVSGLAFVVVDVLAWVAQAA